MTLGKNVMVYVFVCARALVSAANVSVTDVAISCDMNGSKVACLCVFARACTNFRSQIAITRILFTNQCQFGHKTDI